MTKGGWRGLLPAAELIAGRQEVHTRAQKPWWCREIVSPLSAEHVVSNWPRDRDSGLRLSSEGHREERAKAQFHAQDNVLGPASRLGPH